MTTEPERWHVTRRFKRGMHQIAADLRQRSTLSEALLWEAIRNRKLEGRKFRRQVPVGAFVLDFYCAEERLAIEIDGGIHETQQEADALRQQVIESLNIHFLRFSDQQVEQSLDSVLQTIQTHINR